MTIRRHLTAYTVAVALTASVTACTGDSKADPATSGGDTLSSQTSTPTSNSTTPLTEEQRAYQTAEKTYRAWMKNYAEAGANFDATKVDRTLITDEIFSQISETWPRLAKAGPGTQQISQDIRDITGTRYVPGKEVQLQVCAVTNLRFLDQGGKDVTTTPEKKPKPVFTEPKANQIRLVSTDNGKTWRVAYFIDDGGVGISC